MFKKLFRRSRSTATAIYAAARKDGHHPEIATTAKPAKPAVWQYDCRQHAAAESDWYLSLLMQTRNN